MFLESSRYAKLKTVDVVLGDGRTVKAVTLRRLPAVKGVPTILRAHDRLDILAQQKYRDATQFWHIADANSELQASDLLKDQGPEVGTIKLPES